jgi:integrase
MQAKLSKRLIDALRPSSEGEVRVWDSEVKGFVIRVFPGGRKSFGVKYRIGSRQRWFTIGNVGDPWTVEEARERAKKVIRGAEDGVDLQTVKEERRTALTIDDVIARYLQEGPRSKPEKRASSWRHDTSRLRRHVSPLLGRRPASELSFKDVERLQADIVAGKTAASTKGKKRGVARVRGGTTIAGGVVRTLAAMMSWALRDGLVASNPCVGVKRIAPPKRERYLNWQEVRTLLSAADALAQEGAIPRSFADAVLLLALTGARRSEILELRWSEVDLDRARIILPRHRSKTGEKAITLNQASVAVLRRQPRTDQDHVFPGRGGMGPLVGVSKRWELVRARAGLPDLHMHDLRHTFASFAVANGASLFLVGKALGHTQATTTERYAHLADDPVRAVAESVAQQILGRPEKPG